MQPSITIDFDICRNKLAKRVCYVENSANYGYTLRAIDTTRHAFVQLSATYTFGFGKKIKRGNEASQQTGVSSGILK